ARGAGGEFDALLSRPKRPELGEVLVTALTSRELLSWRMLRERAAAAGLLIPSGGKEAQGDWELVLDHAYEERQVVELSEELEVSAVVEDCLRDVLRSLARGETAEDLDGGSLVEAGEVLAVTPGSLIGSVRKLLPDEPPKRAEILTAAQALGGQVERH